MAAPDPVGRLLQPGLCGQFPLEVDEARVERRQDPDDLVVDFLHEAMMKLAGSRHDTLARPGAIAALDVFQKCCIGIEGILRLNLGT